MSHLSITRLVLDSARTIDKPIDFNAEGCSSSIARSNLPGTKYHQSSLSPCDLRIGLNSANREQFSLRLRARR
ncbi:hypothetical protein BN2475_120091 [Paraburkholderia ribeironis]|uniref:Uncharacterized protein n=1 Tax=Paraburkholderia ribeironis TaxID=1247936 RepID=A0A1N7RR31_9BURK|nr:hypothetical protein BN2475_120091 [Paraburkholderia ribeironis]